MHGLCVMLCEVLTVGVSASLWVGRLVGGDACGIVCRVLARESGKWLGGRVLGACAALRRAARRRRTSIFESRGLYFFRPTRRFST